MIMNAPSETPPSHQYVSSPFTSQGNKKRFRTPHPHDVLCGRGGGINNHEGNKTFRNWVFEKKETYNLATSKAAKAEVTREIVDRVKNLYPAGRFLTRDDHSFWVEIDVGKAMAKTSQALREGAPSIRARAKEVTKSDDEKIPESTNGSELNQNLLDLNSKKEKGELKRKSQGRKKDGNRGKKLKTNSLDSPVADARSTPPLLLSPYADPTFPILPCLHLDDNLFSLDLPMKYPSMPAKQKFQREHSLALSDISPCKELRNDTFKDPFSSEEDINGDLARAVEGHPDFSASRVHWLPSTCDLEQPPLSPIVSLVPAINDRILNWADSMGDLVPNTNISRDNHYH